MKKLILLASTIVFAFFTGCANSVSTENISSNAASASSVYVEVVTIATSNQTIMANFGDGNWYNSICYSGYRKGQSPITKIYPSDAEVLEDLQILSKNSNFTYIRMYDTGPHCETALKVIKDNNLPIKVYMGIAVGYPMSGWSDRQRYDTNYPAACSASDTNELTNFFRLYNEYSNQMLCVAVGNECLVDWSTHQVPGSILNSYILWVKSNTTLPVSFDEDVGWWAKNNNFSHHGDYHATILSNCDFVAIHTYPLKAQIIDNVDNKARITNSLSNTIASYNMTKAVCGDKMVVIGEAGWANGGTFFQTMTGEPNEFNQKIYYDKVIPWAKENNILFFWFEAFDEYWKGSKTDIEQYWGLFLDDGGTNRVATLAMFDLYPELIKPGRVPGTNVH